MPLPSRQCRISVAQAGNDAGVIGAGLLAAQELALNRDTADLASHGRSA